MARGLRNWSQDRLSEETADPQFGGRPVSKATIQGLETGRVRNPNTSTSMRLLRALGYSSEQQAAEALGMDELTKASSPGRGIPILGFVPEDVGQRHAAAHIPRVLLPTIDDDDAYAFVIQDDRMEPRYPRGSVVIASPGSDVRSGMYCTVRYRHGRETHHAVARVFELGGGQISLAWEKTGETLTIRRIDLVAHHPIIATLRPDPQAEQLRGGTR
jgi:phage repressor protein C with HTH and peptisase S24 domain